MTPNFVKDFPVQTPLLELIAHLRERSSFEGAANLIIEKSLALVDAAIARSALAGEGRTLRGSLHIRTESGYRGVAQWIKPGEAETEALAAASMWEWVRQHEVPIAADLALGMLQPLGKEETITLDIEGDVHDEVISGRTSLLLFLERDATHVLLVPLHDVRGHLIGMACLEVRCERALGGVFVWEACVHQLMDLFASALPYFIDHPFDEEHELEALVDEFLPVLGRQMRPRVEVLAAFAQQDETVLLTGPTGTGKSRLARWCHARSLRRDEPFESLDLMSVPEGMQMAHLVGWKRGAFTGAQEDVEGAIARAQGGTLFIDEIDKLSLDTQAGLLRLMETRTYRRLGDSQGDRRADVRFVVGTNADLAREVARGTFREDLLYRIQVLPVEVSPLSQRMDELAQWASYMLERQLEERDIQGIQVTLTEQAVSLLRSRRWPGNLRQLDNVMRRVFALAQARQFGSTLVILPEHIHRALSMERVNLEDGRREVAVAMERAAEVFVSAAQRARERGEVFSLEWSEVFKGLVLEVAHDRTGDLEATFEVLGKKNLLKGRNHYKAWRREQQRVASFREALKKE